MNEDAPDLAETPDLEIDAVLDRFEDAWNQGTVPNIKTFLPTAGQDGSRRLLLSELVKLDLEFRWRQKQAPLSEETQAGPPQQDQTTAVKDDASSSGCWLLEQYIQEFPQLGSVDELPLALIVEEYRVRQRWGDRPSHQDYLERFSRYADEIPSALSEVDEELVAEPTLLTAETKFKPTQETMTVLPGRPGIEDGEAADGIVSSFGDYELLDEIGRGGMGVVYRAHQKSLRRVVAIKMILPGQLADQASIERFYTEAQIVAQLRHPNIVMVHEVAEHRGHHYFSMDYIEGESLAGLIRNRQLSANEAADYVRTIAKAIHFAHEAGILHRDLKPSNILTDSNGQPLVTDFGLAKRTKEDSGLTKTGNIIGTPSYMSPEQVGMGNKDTLGPASDVYSLGAILYELLTGRPPFCSESMLETLMQVLEREPVAPRLLAPGTSHDLETITLKCLQKDPQQRYSSAAELADELGRYLEGEPIVARPISRLSRAWRWCKRRPALAGMYVAAVLLLLTISIAVPAVMRARQQADQSKVLADAKLLEEENKRQLELLKAEARSLEQFDLYPITLPLYEQVVDLRSKLRESDKRESLVELNSLANVYAELGHFDAMVRVCERIVQDIQQLPEADYDKDKRVAMNNLAYACEMNGELDRATKLYESVHAKMVSELGATHRHTLIVENNLAVCLAAIGQSEKAFSLLESNIRRRKQLVEQEKVSAAFVLIPRTNLCWLYFQSGMLEKCGESIEQYDEDHRRADKLQTDRTLASVELHHKNNEWLLYLLSYDEERIEPEIQDFDKLRKRGGPRLSEIVMSSWHVMSFDRSRGDYHVAMFGEDKPGRGDGSAAPGPPLDRSIGWQPRERVIAILPLVLPRSRTTPAIVQRLSALHVLDQKIASASRAGIEGQSLFAICSLRDLYLKQGDAAKAQGRSEAAKTLYNQALVLTELLDEPQFGSWLNGVEGLFFLEGLRGDVYLKLGRIDDAEKCIDRTISRTKRLLEDAAKVVSSEVDNDSPNDSSASSDQRDSPEELILDYLRNGELEVGLLLNELMLAYVNRGDLEARDGRLDEAESSYGTAIAVLSDAQSEKVHHALFLALAYSSLADLASSQGNSKDAAIWSEKARNQWRKKTDRNGSELKGCTVPSSPRGIRKIINQRRVPYFTEMCTWGESDAVVNAWWIHELERISGMAFLEMGRFPEAELFLWRSYHGYQNRIETVPPVERVRLLFVLKSLSRLYQDWNKPAKAEEIAGLLEEPLALSEYSHGLEVAYFKLADPRDQPGKAEATQAAYREQLTLLRMLVKKYPELHRYKNALGTVLNDYANLLLRTGQLDASMLLYQEAKSLYDITAQDKDDEVAQDFCRFRNRQLAHVWLNIGLLCKMKGDQSGTVMAAQKVRQLTLVEQKGERAYQWAGAHASRAYCLYHAACLVAALSRDAAADETLPLRERQQKADSYASQAVELLRDCVLVTPVHAVYTAEADLAAYYFDKLGITIREEYISLVKSDPYLDFLRKRQDLQDILGQFEEKKED